MKIDDIEKSVDDLKAMMSSVLVRMKTMERKVSHIEEFRHFLYPPQYQPFQNFSVEQTCLPAQHPNLPAQQLHIATQQPNPPVQQPTPPAPANQSNTPAHQQVPPSLYLTPQSSQSQPQLPVTPTLPNVTPHFVMSQCKAIHFDPKQKYLPSTNIQKQKLRSPEDVLQKYSNLRGRAKVGLLTVKLAKEAFFGENVMVMCTVNGKRQLPGLPLAELNSLKQTVFQQFPEFWNNCAEFEDVWGVCVDALNQSCKHTRTMAQKRGLDSAQK